MKKTTDAYYDDSRSVKRLRWRKEAAKNGGCEMCPPHRGENRGPGEFTTHGPRKPKRKDKRR